MPFSFRLGSFGRWNRQPVYEKPLTPTGGLAPAYDGPGGPATGPVPQPNLRQATMPRFMLSAITAGCFFLTLIFTIIVEIGNTHDKAGLRDIWFLKLYLANIDPIPGEGSGLGYGLGTAVGMSDFYQIGLWNYCKGMNGTGITSCTKPDVSYWFDPIGMFNQQLSDTYGNGTATLPQNMYDSLDEIRICSHVMFGLFMAGAILSFLMIPTVFAGVKSKWISGGLAVISFLNFLCVAAATIIATAIFVVLRNLFRAYVEILNLVPHIGPTMFAMMWIATIFSLIAFILQLCLSCFTNSQRDIRRRYMPGKSSF